MEPVKFKADAETCVRCGLCVKDCLEGIIELGEIPAIAPENRGRCIHCGHCQAICPTASISLDGHAAGDLEAMPNPLSEADVTGLIRGRRSVREYKTEPVDEKLLERIIDLASYAPTSTNSRQIGYLIVNGREKVEKLGRLTADIMRKDAFLTRLLEDAPAGRDRIFRGAPCVLIAHAPEAIPLSAADCATALAALELALPSFGLASCWAGIFTVVCGKETSRELPLPQGDRIYGALMIGRPAIAYKRVPFRSRPRIDWLNL
ncbi:MULTISPECIES: nitroreductase family protein [unclassified Desulfovibrio]|uniref:nitroreductase family protein n=1 Tax=unclassified Desulfovibrio TaxID=2593640 RepID=UPI0013EA0900|nr:MULTISPECIES: nitroreductase family protein [unclassified Desulfovibrio]